ncbi:hypothetical protein D3C75_796480 [compost metagenome]
MAKQTYINATTGGSWVDIVAGECTISSLVMNATVQDTIVALRILKGGTTPSAIIPSNNLEFNSPHRPAVGGISLKATDKLQCLSEFAVDWITTVVTGAAYDSAVVTSPAGNAWTTLTSGPATVRAIFASMASGGTLGIRLHKTASDAAIVLSENVSVAGAKRLLTPIVLAAGDSLQVQSSNSAQWIATGIGT